MNTAKLRYNVADIDKDKLVSIDLKRKMHKRSAATNRFGRCRSLSVSPSVGKSIYLKARNTITSLKREHYLSTAIGQKRLVSQKIQNQLFFRQNIEDNIVKSSLLCAIVWPCGQMSLLYTSKRNVLILSFEAEHLSSKVLMFLLQSGRDHIAYK